MTIRIGGGCGSGGRAVSLVVLDQMIENWKCRDVRFEVHKNIQLEYGLAPILICLAFDLRNDLILIHHLLLINLQRLRSRNYFLVSLKETPRTQWQEEMHHWTRSMASQYTQLMPRETRLSLDPR